MKSEVLAHYAVTGIQPNKTLEPTSTSVTLRAIVCSFEMELWTDNLLGARSAPAVAVAHL